MNTVVGWVHAFSPATRWGAFVAFVLVALAVDILAHRGHRATSTRAAIAWSGFWIGLAVLFGLGVGAVSGVSTAEDFFAAYLLEKALSVDNLFVFLLVFSRLRIDAAQERRVLTWGILGALVFRGVFVLAGAALLARFSWVGIVFGVVLVVTAIKLWRDGDQPNEESRLLSWALRVLPISKEKAEDRFFVRRAGRLLVTPLFVALVVIELTDVVFAVDSIPAAFSVTTNAFVVYASNVLALLGLRSLYVVLASGLARLRHLRYGLVAVLLFAGAKLIVAQWLHVPPAISLAIIGALIGVPVATSFLVTAPSTPRRRGPLPAPGARG